MKSLFWRIFKANGEGELGKIIMEHPDLKKEENWFPYGADDKLDRSNFGTFDGQQPNPVPALIEKITNSIDSLLLKECRLRGVNPKSKEAPKSMEEAVEKYFGIKKGDFSEVGTKERRNIGENIQLIATGDSRYPDLIIYDEGEGQHPDEFKNTFLSLRKNNKTDIRFVQGKYNQGSTGAVIFCGKYRYQLIASKSDDRLNAKKGNPFGFTLVRRHPLTEEQEEGYGSSWYEYFLINENIPRFNIDNLDLDLWKRTFKTGSIIKLYSYQLPRGTYSNIERDLWRDLNQYLYKPALPFIVYDTRILNKTPTTPVLGNKRRIDIDDRKKKEKTKFHSFTNQQIGEVTIHSTIFKSDVKPSEFIRDKAVVFTLNGQVHGSLPRRFISKDLGLSMLKDSMLIHIDCTKIRTSFRQDLFMANRYNMKEGVSYQTLLDNIVNIIKSDEEYREINQNRKNMIYDDAKKDEEILKSIIESVPFDKELIKILRHNGDLSFLLSSKKKEKNGKNGEKSEREEKPLISRRFPSVFRIDLKDNAQGKKVKSIPLNGKGNMDFETDVENEYLFRPKEPGEFKIQVLGIKHNNTTGGTDKGKPKKVEDIFDVTVAGPTNDSIRVTFEPKSDISVGDEIEISAKLTSPSGDLESIFYIRIVDPKKPGKTVKEKEQDKPSLPKPIQVYKGDVSWKHFGWTENDIVKLMTINELGNDMIEAIAVNMDSYALTRYISTKRLGTESKIKFAKQQYFTAVYLHSLFLYGIVDKYSKTEDSFDFDVDDFISKVFQYYSTFLLYANTSDILLSSFDDD